jgi:hypothetical protein
MSSKTNPQDVGCKARQAAQDANKRQLEIWKKTLDYEIQMMAPISVPACNDFINRLEHFEKQMNVESENGTPLPAADKRFGNGIR